MVVNIPGLPKVPEKGLFENPADALWFILTNPCGTPPTVLISTAFNPALNAAIELVWIDYEDILSSVASPENPKGSKLGSKKGARGKKRKKPSLNQTLGTALDDLFGHPLDIGKNKKWTTGQLTLWGLYELTDRFLFAWLVIGVTDDFLINWASLLYLETKDPLKCPDGVKAKGNGGGATPIAGWVPLLTPDVTYQRGDCGWVTLFGTVGPGLWSVSAAFDGSTEEGDNPTVQTQIGLFRDPFYVEEIAVSSIVEVGAGTNSSLVVSANVEGPELLYAAIRCGNGNWNSTEDGALINIRKIEFPPE